MNVSVDADSVRPVRYDLALFRQLNKEYASKPLVPRPLSNKPVDLMKRGKKRAAAIASKYDLKGKRVLEIGCGRGATCKALAENHRCDVVGVDIVRYDDWANAPSGATLLQLDLTESRPDLGSFDFIYSNAVFEHVRHPYSMLKAAHDLLNPGGEMYIAANLYRGPKASHRYRHVYFPWPHLLFTDEVFEEFFISIGREPMRASWVNQLSIADYYRYFDIVGFERLETSFNTTPIDEAFYRRFVDKLERIPRYDLERDFLKVRLQKPATKAPQPKRLSTWQRIKEVFTSR